MLSMLSNFSQNGGLAPNFAVVDQIFRQSEHCPTILRPPRWGPRCRCLGYAQPREVARHNTQLTPCRLVFVDKSSERHTASHILRAFVNLSLSVYACLL